MKKFKPFILLVALALLLSGCGFLSAGRNDLTIMGKESDLNKTYMTRIFERYEKATGKKIKLISFEDSEFETQALNSFKEGKGPDVILHFNNADLNMFNVSENFCRLNDEEWVGELTDSSRAYCEDDDGNLLGLPFWESSVSGCYYNKTLLDSLGLKPAATQDEFNVLCQVLADTGYTPICWPANGCSWMFQFALDPLFDGYPERLEKLNTNEITYADIPEIKDMVNWIKSAADKGWFGSNYLETGWNEISPAISSGSAVMTFIWDTWFDTDFVAGKYSADDFALMPVFMNTVKSGTYEGGNLNMMLVNKNAENRETALDFLAFCAQPDNYNAAFEGISTVSCFKNQTSNIQSKMVTDAAESISENERVSTASTRIIGYSADDVANAFVTMLREETDADGCIKLMDSRRISKAGF